MNLQMSFWSITTLFYPYLLFVFDPIYFLNYKLRLSWFPNIPYCKIQCLIPTQYCLSSSNSKFGCCKICSSSQVASSLGKSFHCTKYYFIVMFLNLLSLVFNILSRMRTSFPSSSKGGKLYKTKVCFPITFFRHETWNMKYITNFTSHGKLQFIGHFSNLSNHLVGTVKPWYEFFWTFTLYVVCF